MYKADK